MLVHCQHCTTYHIAKKSNARIVANQHHIVYFWLKFNTGLKYFINIKHGKAGVLLFNVASGNALWKKVAVSLALRALLLMIWSIWYDICFIHSAIEGASFYPFIERPICYPCGLAQSDLACLVMYNLLKWHSLKKSFTWFVNNQQLFKTKQIHLIYLK